MAQWLEVRVRYRKVVGSIPTQNTLIFLVVSLPVAKQPPLHRKNSPTRHQAYYIRFVYYFRLS